MCLHAPGTAHTSQKHELYDTFYTELNIFMTKETTWGRSVTPTEYYSEAKVKKTHLIRMDFVEQLRIINPLGKKLY